jgi:carbon-monoxide dehydrogenase medium subunit
MAREDDYLTVAEIAQLLRVHRTTVWRWITAGRLRAYRVGDRTLRVRREDVQSLLRPAAAYRPEPATPPGPAPASAFPKPRSVLSVTGGRGAGMYPPRFEYTAPGSLQEALVELALHGDEAKVLAGGQSLIPLMKLRFSQPGRLVDINRVGELHFLREEADGLHLGALCRHRDVERSELIRSRYPTLASCAPQVADPLVRNLGTVVGSLCHADPQGDWGAVAVALEARLVAHSTRGQRTIPATEFFLGPLTTTLQPDELVTEVVFPAPAGQVFGRYLKLERKVGDFATVGVAVFLSLSQGRVLRAGIGLTAAGPTYVKARGAEALLTGNTLTNSLAAEAARKAAEESDPASDHRGSAHYKRQVVRVFVHRALRQAMGLQAA